MNINLGSGLDYRDGFLNIDGSSFVGADLVMDISANSIMSEFDENSIEFILANDIIEHFTHWEAIDILCAIFKIMKPGGSCQVRMPDTDQIINSQLSTSDKIRLLYGGQDIGGSTDHEKQWLDSRREYPRYFCHKYGWTKESFCTEAQKIGFDIPESVKLNGCFSLKSA